MPGPATTPQHAAQLQPGYGGAKVSKSKAVGAKISKLRSEGVPQRQAVATALAMQRTGRLGPKGGYKRARG